MLFRSYLETVINEFGLMTDLQRGPQSPKEYEKLQKKSVNESVEPVGKINYSIQLVPAGAGLYKTTIIKNGSVVKHGIFDADDLKVIEKAIASITSKIEKKAL